MNFQSICLMIAMIINLTIVTATSTVAINTIENEVTSSSSLLPSTLSTPSSHRTGKQFIDELVQNGTLDSIPGKQIIKLLDPPTKGLINKIIHSMKDSTMDKVDLIGLSGIEVLRMVEKQSKGQVSSSLNNVAEKDLASRWNQLKESSTQSKSKRAGPDSMSGWVVGSSKRSARSVQPEEFTGSPSKRNFDEIDRSELSGFAGKRNFDEIDRSAFVGFNGKRNFDEIDRSGLAGFRGKKNFDEIDRSSFTGFTGGKRDNHYYLRQLGLPFGYRLASLAHNADKKNFDEIDRTNLNGFRGRRNFDEIDSSGFTGFYKRNYDEIDNSGFNGFVGKRNFDEIDRSAFSGFTKRNNALNEEKLKTPKA
ncbi:uncharacterized protein LOC107359907 [Tetranychus urticae]|uniref:Orcokinin n=1 Tax=Tetranychus urticae TaxID=32264 RepID=T1K158_TETUR|nr:uncharacterized protein LOC107359907 [Tetranychus urticae]